MTRSGKTQDHVSFPVFKSLPKGPETSLHLKARTNSLKEVQKMVNELGNSHRKHGSGHNLNIPVFSFLYSKPLSVSLKQGTLGYTKVTLTLFQSGSSVLEVL